MKVDLTAVERLYSENIRKFGAVSKSVGWNTAESQALRFEQLAKLLDGASEPVSINELGCGYGELFKYLARQGRAPRRYNGYDISEDMLDAARDHLGQDDRVSLVKSSKLTQEADFSVCSGIFNVRLGAGDEAWLAHIESTLQDMHTHSKHGFAFNLLTSYVDWKDGNLFYGDPLFFARHCLEQFSRRVVVIHDYPLYEWTILVRK